MNRLVAYRLWLSAVVVALLVGLGGTLYFARETEPLYESLRSDSAHRLSWTPLLGVLVPGA